jgi:glycine/D-amino acid oxidase-like deaminating enzyme
MNEGFYDVIVIGGGISGLTTAYRLLQHDPSLKILVLEAKGIEMQSASVIFIITVFDTINSQ